MTLDDYIRVDEYGEMFVCGHRIPIQSVLWPHLKDRLDGRQLARRFPTLSLDEVYGVLAYYYHNKSAIDTYLAETEAEIAKQEADYFREKSRPTTDELKARSDKLRSAREPASSSAR